MSDEAEQSGAGGDGRVRRRRRRWSEARKRRIVAESYQPGVSVSVVARRRDVNANQVFGWRRQYRELARVVGGFVPVVVSSTEGAEPAKPLPGPTDIEPSLSGRIEIALADGSRVTVDRDVDAAALSRVLGVSGAAMIPVPSGGAGLARDRRDGHAARDEHAGASGPAGSRAGPACGVSVRKITDGILPDSAQII